MKLSHSVLIPEKVYNNLADIALKEKKRYWEIIDLALRCYDARYPSDKDTRRMEEEANEAKMRG